MNIEKTLAKATVTALKKLYNADISSPNFEKTNPDFSGDFTLVVFPYLKISKKKPEETAAEIGEFLKLQLEVIEDYNVINGFLNITISDSYWLEFFYYSNDRSFLPLHTPENAPVVLVEYSSPNTNKPLHLGHVRNNLLGFSVAQILNAAGYKVIKVNLVNDRGIHICKSMLAWQKWGKGESPEN